MAVRFVLHSERRGAGLSPAGIERAGQWQNFACKSSSAAEVLPRVFPLATCGSVQTSGHDHSERGALEGTVRLLLRTSRTSCGYPPCLIVQAPSPASSLTSNVGCFGRLTTQTLAARPRSSADLSSMVHKSAAAAEYSSKSVHAHGHSTYPLLHETSEALAVPTRSSDLHALK